MNDVLEKKGITGGVESVPGLKHHDLKVCGGPLSVYEAGDTGKPKVVMLHGAMYDEARFIWDQMFPFLSKDYHMFALDTPRHGRSRPWKGNLDHSRLMDILHNAFDQLGLDHFSLVGLSMGGGLSIEYASLHPDRVRSMANTRSTRHFPNDFSIRQQSRDAVAVLSKLGETKALVVGNSSGAVITLDMATAFPEHVHAAVIHEAPIQEDSA